MALSNPFDGPLASIPDFPSVPSRRMRTFARGTCSTSATTGFGFIAVSPYNMGANDSESVHYSDSTYGGTVIDTDIAVAGVNTASSNSDYSIADFTVVSDSGTQGRIVATGLRIRTISTELNRGGQVVGIQTPNHTLLDGLSFTQVNGYDCSKRFAVNRKWKTALYCPVFQGELIYSRGFGTPGTAFNPYPILGFVIQSASPSNSISYEWEVFTVLEVNGRDVRGLQPSAADPAGFAATQTTAQMTMMRPHEATSAQHSKALMQGVHAVAHHTLSGFLGKGLESGVKWVENNGLPLLAGLAPLLAL